MMRSTKFIAIVATLLVGANAGTKDCPNCSKTGEVGKTDSGEDCHFCQGSGKVSDLCRLCRRSEGGEATAEQHKKYLKMQRGGLNVVTGDHSATDWTKIEPSRYAIIKEIRRAAWNLIENCPNATEKKQTLKESVNMKGRKCNKCDGTGEEMCPLGSAACWKCTQCDGEGRIIPDHDWSPEPVTKPVSPMSILKAKTIASSKMSKTKETSPVSSTMEPKPEIAASKPRSVCRLCKTAIKKTGKPATPEAHVDYVHIKRTCPPEGYDGFSSLPNEIMDGLRDEFKEIEQCLNIDPIQYHMVRKDAIQRARIREERAIRERQMKIQQIMANRCIKCEGKGTIKKWFGKKKNCDKCGGSGHKKQIVKILDSKAQTTVSKSKTTVPKAETTV